MLVLLLVLVLSWASMLVSFSRLVATTQTNTAQMQRNSERFAKELHSLQQTQGKWRETEYFISELAWLNQHGSKPNTNAVAIHEFGYALGDRLGDHSLACSIMFDDAAYANTEATYLVSCTINYCSYVNQFKPEDKTACRRGADQSVIDTKLITPFSFAIRAVPMNTLPKQFSGTTPGGISYLVAETQAGKSWKFVYTFYSPRAVSTSVAEATDIYGEYALTITTYDAPSSESLEKFAESVIDQVEFTSFASK